MRLKRVTRAWLALLALPWLCLDEAAAQTSRVGARRPPVGDTAQQRLRLRAGPFEIMPYLRLGQAGVDTNVFYSPEDRRTDFFARGGPGLQVGLPIRRVRFYVDGDLNYYWFARSREERHLGGEASGGFEWTASKFALAVSRFYTRSYERPSIEVDRRVLRDQWTTEVYLSLNAGNRLRLSPVVRSERAEVPSTTEYLGTDLRRTLTQDRYIAGLDVRLRIAPKTDFVILGDQEWIRSPESETRGVDSNLAAGGFALSSPTRLSGSIIGGAQFFRPKDKSRGGRFTRPYAEAGLEWKFREKTSLGATYRYETQLSAFETNEKRLPTLERQEVGAFFRQRFGERLELILSGRLETLGNDVAVVIRRRGGQQEIVRDDQFYSAAIDLGYWFWKRFRLGAVATYNERQSNFGADFGVEGLLLGASIRFNP